MKIRSTFLLFLFVITSFIARSQTTAWTPIFLTASGNHIVNGVEAYFKQDVCDGQGVVFIKFVNTNSYAVSLEWYNAVFTQELAWIHRDQDQKSVIVPASTTVNGACSGELVLIVDLSLFITDASQFKRLSTVGLTINAAN